MFIDSNGVVRRPVAYLAGFEMFYPNGDEIGAAYKKLCARYGIDGIYPPDPLREGQFSEYVPRDDSPGELQKKYFLHDVSHIRSSDLIIANLNDFRRGQEPDSGTCFECGAAYALGLSLYCFISDDRPMTERFSGEKHRDENGNWADSQNNTIENFDLPLNLMFSVPFTVVRGTLEDALRKIRTDFDEQLVKAGHSPFKIEE